MRAVVVHAFGPADGHAVEDFADPEPGPDGVLIDVHAIGVNFSDTLMMAGSYQLRPERPFVPGRDAAGVVAEIGENVTRCRPGDRVMALVPYGAYAERLAAPQSRCVVIPDGMDFVTAAGDIKAKGVDTIACLAVNDAFVMGAWGKDQNVGDNVLMLADGSAAFTTALDTTLDLTERGLGVRSRRYSAIVDDGVVTHINLEEGGGFEVSDAATILTQL